MTIYPFQAMLPVLEQIDDPDLFFSQVREHYDRLITEGLYRQNDIPCFFVYEIETTFRKHRGMICLVSLDDYRQGKIIRHEHTINTKVKIQIELLEKRQAVVKPVLLTYRQQSSIDEWIRKHTEEHAADWTIPFTQSDEKHRCWMIFDDQHIRRIQALFATEVSHTYIADGHHRMETSDRFFKGKQGASAPVLCGLFSDSMLEIEGFHRVIHTELAAKPAQLLIRLAEIFDIEPLAQRTRPQRAHELCMYLAQNWYRLRWKTALIQTTDSSSTKFDTALLHKHVLTDIFNIWDVRASANVSYESGETGLLKVQEAVDQNPESVAFCLHPVSIASMMQVADADSVLPPKSTWFVPRLRNGVIVQKI